MIFQSNPVRRLHINTGCLMMTAGNHRPHLVPRCRCDPSIDIVCRRTRSETRVVARQQDLVMQPLTRSMRLSCITLDVTPNGVMFGRKAPERNRKGAGVPPRDLEKRSLGLTNHCALHIPSIAHSLLCHRLSPAVPYELLPVPRLRVPDYPAPHSQYARMYLRLWVLFPVCVCVDRSASPSYPKKLTSVH